MSEEQTKQLERVLRPVAGRLRQAELRPRLVRAALLGSAVALVPAVLRLFTGSLTWWVVGLLLLFGVPLITLALALASKPNLRRAALAVDLHYRWQDRITTAWSALSVGGLTPLEQFQAQDAVSRVAQVAPATVVPLKVPGGILKSAGLALLVLCALVWPIGYYRETSPAVVKPPPVAAEQEAKPLAAISLPTISPQVAAASLNQVRFSENDADATADSPTSPLPYSRLIHDYFEAVCPPGR